MPSEVRGQNIVPQWGLKLLDMTYWGLDMELCRGSLDEYLAGNMDIYWEQDPPDSKTLIAWESMKQITAGLKFLHTNNKIHGNLKPSNGNVGHSLGS
jgi:serine/threonine protein kinase